MNKIRFKWPIWFPYPSSWLRVLSIIPFLYIGGISSIVLVFCVLIMIMGDPEGRAFSFLMATILLAVLLVCAFIYALIHHKAVRRAKGWIPTLLSDWKGLYAMIVLNVAVLPFWILYFLFGERKYYRYGYGRVALDSITDPQIFTRVEISEGLARTATILFLLTAVFMFQFEFINFNRWLKKKEKRLRKKQEREAITKEMEEMKAEIDKKRKERIAKCKRKTLVSQNKKRKK